MVATDEVHTLTAAAPFIPLWRLSIALIPAGAVLLILHRWAIQTRTPILAICRMLLQLLLLGYVLTYVFDETAPWNFQLAMVLIILPLMLFAASWISLRVASEQRTTLLRSVSVSVAVGGGLTLLVITQGVIQPDPWYRPRVLIPLAGMIFSNCMNAVSLAVERYHSEIRRGEPDDVAGKTALEASLIPITNSLFAVGLVSIPGMMTGQVLSGESTINAARYQIMVMLMMFGSAGLSAAMSLHLLQAGSSASTAYEPGHNNTAADRKRSNSADENSDAETRPTTDCSEDG